MLHAIVGVGQSCPAEQGLHGSGIFQHLQIIIVTHLLRLPILQPCTCKVRGFSTVCKQSHYVSVTIRTLTPLVHIALNLPVRVYMLQVDMCAGVLHEAGAADEPRQHEGPAVWKLRGPGCRPHPLILHLPQRLAGCHCKPHPPPRPLHCAHHAQAVPLGCRLASGRKEKWVMGSS